MGIPDKKVASRKGLPRGATQTVEVMLGDLIPWSGALQAMRLEASERGMLSP